MGLPISFFRPRCRTQGGLAALLVPAAAVLLAQSAHAQRVTATYTMSGGLFNYNFTVQNPTAFTLADVNVSFPTFATGTNLAAPAGFQTTFDPSGNGSNMGIADFTTTDGTKDFFANTTTSGFLLTSNRQLAGSPFMTIDVNGNSVNGVLTTSASSSPEPGALGLLALGMTPVATLVSLRRRFVASAS